jgi:RNA polymerase sigma factor (sigma-70 family)
MKDQTKCFILTPDGYEEITYAELIIRQEADPSYTKRRFIPVHGMLMEVSEEEYRDFYRVKRRQTYIDEEASRAGAFSYNALDTDEMNGEDIIPDPSPPLADAIADKLMLEALRIGLDKLSEDERALIEALYFEGKSERELARESGIPDMTLNYRKRKILAKLKTLMGF